MTVEDVARARARAQLLADRGQRRVDEVVAAMVGVQAQDEAAAAFSIRARSRGLVAADVVAARSDDRSVVLTWTLRGTRHYHHRDDVRWLLALLGPVFNRPDSRRAAGLGIAGAVGERAVRALRDAIATDGPLSRADVKERLAPVGVAPSGQAPIHVIRRAALEGVLCVIPGERYALLDDWLGPAPARPFHPERAAAELARRYTAMSGPATAADFAAWSGLGTAAAQHAWAAAPAPQRRAGRVPLRLVGGFDNLLLAYADRSPALAPEHARLVNAGGGLVKPVVAADGRVAGTWAYRAGTVEVRPFRPFSDDEAADIDGEIADIGRFTGVGR